MVIGERNKKAVMEARIERVFKTYSNEILTICRALNIKLNIF